MMSKYIIIFKNYDSPFWDGSYKTEWLVLALIKFIKYRSKYDSVEFNYRKLH